MQPRQNTATLFVESDSWIQRLHPFTKLCYIMLTGVAIFAGPSTWVLDVLLVLMNILLAAGGRMLKSLWPVLLRIIVPLAVFMIPIHSFLHPDNQVALIHIYGLTLYQEGMTFALTILLQITAVLLASLLFVLSTHPADLITAISQTGNSPSLAYILGSPLLLISAMRERVTTIQSAQRARGLHTDGNVIRRCCSLAPLVVPLVMGAIIETEQRSIALEVRGFTSHNAKTSLRTLADSTPEQIARWVMATFTVSIIYIRLF